MTSPPLRFGRYQVRDRDHDVLGRGSFGTVYRAFDTALQREVAVKVLGARWVEDDPDIRERFLRETRVLARLDHPNIISIYDVGEAGGRPYFAMKLIEGTTLASLLRSSGPLPLEEVVQLLRELGAAVDYLHAHRLVHRDIKAANAMVEVSGRVVLMDFGIVRIEGSYFTDTGARLGTPEAMAPEQARGEPAGPAADIYALGVLTFQLLGGRPPFQGAYEAVLSAHKYDAPPPLADFRSGLAEPVYAAIEAALAKDPVMRPTTAAEFVAALTQPAPPEPAPAFVVRPQRQPVSPPAREPAPQASTHGATGVGAGQLVSPVPRAPVAQDSTPVQARPARHLPQEHVPHTTAAPVPIESPPERWLVIGSRIRKLLPVSDQMLIRIIVIAVLLAATILYLMILSIIKVLGG